MMRTTIYSIYESARCIGMNELPELFEDYYGEEEETPIYESDSYWQFNELVNQVEGEAFFYDLNHNILNGGHTKFLVTGCIGWYEHYHKVKPAVIEGFEEAVGYCLDGSDTCEVEFKEGSVIVHAHHHDGCNWFEVRRLSEKGINEAEKAVSSKKTMRESPDWFNPLKLNEIEIRV